MKCDVCRKLGIAIEEIHSHDKNDPYIITLCANLTLHIFNRKKGKWGDQLPDVISSIPVSYDLKKLAYKEE